MSADTSWSFTTVAAPPVPAPEGPGGPILVVSSSLSPFSRYTTEILKAEGLNEFLAVDITSVTASMLTNYDVVILGEMTLSVSKASMFSTWVNNGGTLISFRPSSTLYSLMGISGTAGTMSDRYLLIDTSAGPGKGIVGTTIQYHDASDLYNLNGAASIATIYSSATTATSYPAVTIINVGANGGKAIAFSYDLPKSIVYTRQGNPAMAGVETDGQTPIRTDDLFFPNYVDMNKVEIPQADEQQRLLANIILQSNLGKKPLPKFWYMPKQYKAAIVYTLDDHGTATGTRDIFNKMIANSPAGGNLADWTAYSATSWFYKGIPLTNAQAVTYNSQGFEMGVHVQNGSINFTSFADLDNYYTAQIQQFRTAYPGLPLQTTHRFHSAVWSDWLTQAKVELSHGIRYSMDYYYWPPSWIAGRPGLFTGSGFPMHFADTDGDTINVYQGVSQLVNENGIDYSLDVNTLLDNALGAKGYYGFFGTHDDYRDTLYVSKTIAAAKAHNVPIISARQVLKWLDGRNNSYFSNITWNNNQLSFHIAADTLAKNISAMLPLYSDTNQVISITFNGSPISYGIDTIKGMQYAFFDGPTGDYVATYGVFTTGTINGSVTLQGRPAAPNQQWVVDVKVDLYANGNTTTPAYTYNVTTDDQGQFSIPNVVTGTYTIAVKNSHTLQRVLHNQAIALGTNTLNFGTLLEGDANNDNYVTAIDFSVLLNSFNKASGDPGFDPRADFNNDGFVTALDFSLLLANFNTAGEFP